MSFRTTNITYDCEERRLAFTFFLQVLWERKRKPSIKFHLYSQISKSDNSFKALYIDKKQRK